MSKYTFLILALLVVACNRPTKTEVPGVESQVSEATKAIFPHSPEFKTTVLHGEEYFKDRKLCTSCHAFDYSGGSAKVSCYGCHTYPHKAKWAIPHNHGQMYTYEGNACLRCHEENGHMQTAHPDQFVSCSSCHTLIPHSEDLTNGDHAALAGTYQGKCTVCHTDQKRLMPNLDPDGCYSCHDKDQLPRVQWQKP